uniref:secretogranin-1 n=1 Tax=Jaculus jaculus TaxID=51337 RepID=UPI0003331965|nr:secretogranin-1 [Jaculus jaculus]
MLRVALLGLLGATMLAAVSSVPVDNGSHSEEVVTRCIIEVLSNALSKSNIPPITPECQQALKDSGKEVSDEEKSENKNTKFEVRLLRDPVAASVPHWTSSREEAGAPGENTESRTESDTNKWEEGGGHSQEGAGEAQESLYPSNTQVSRETQAHHSEKSEGEERKEEEGEEYLQEENREDAEEEHHPEPGEKQNTFLSDRNQAVAMKKEELVARTDSQSAGNSVEKTHSRELSSQESGEEQRSQEKHPQKLNDDATSQEESVQSEEDPAFELAKRYMRPGHHYGRSRPDRFSQEGSPPSEGRGQALKRLKETDVGKASLGEKRDHYPTHHRASEEEHDSGEEGRSHPVFQAPKNLDGLRYEGRGGEEDTATRLQSEERLKDKRNHPNSELEKLVNRYSKDSREERGSEGSKGFGHRGKAGETDAYSLDTKEEKRFFGEGRYHVQESQLDKARRHPQSKWQEQERNYLNYGDEGVHGKWQLGDPTENREEVIFQDKQYNPFLTTEKRKRLGVLFNPYFDPLQWKNINLEKKANIDDNFPVGEDENGLTLNDKNFFPEYNYDLWEKRPFSEDVNWEYEKRSFPRDPKLDLKRQYDRVAELDQLLHYRKKSAEFPDFYDAEEHMEPRQETENERDLADQGVLTEEEEKELENLAVMDLELQKIAEKFSQRG